MKHLILLTSVSTFVDKNTLDCYPQLENSNPDFHSQTNLDNNDINIDWLDKLSEDDKKTMEGLKEDFYKLPF